LLFQGKPVFWTGLDSSSSGLRRALHKWGAAVVVAAGLAAGGAWVPPASARTPDNPAAVAPVALATLPAEAQTTHRLILRGGPFPYQKDGTVFGNRERLLPLQSRGYYREYTVKTPGASNRGARRIVCGGQPPTRPQACFYTDDHYASFRLIAP
jgi:ribonuclease T1